LGDRRGAAARQGGDSTTGPAGVGHSAELAALNEVAVRLAYMVGQITPEEFDRQDANYERDSALGRELLFLIADNGWTRASSENIAITRSDSFETKVQVDVELDRITHEAFRGRSGPIWLPLLVLPPLYRMPRRRSAWQRLLKGRLRELEPGGLVRVPDALSALSVTDMNDGPLPILSNADIQHRLAAAVTEIIVNMAEERWAGVADGAESPSRDQCLMLSAAVYRLLRGEHVPSAVLQRGRERIIPGAGEGSYDTERRLYPVSRIGRARHVVSGLIDHFSGLLADAGGLSPDHLVGLSELTRRALQVLHALAESTVVVVAAESRETPITMTVTLPSRALHLAPSWWGEMAGDTPKLEWPALLRFLSPSHWNWILPGARLQIAMLLPSAEADRQVEVGLPDGVALDPSRPLDERASLDIRTGEPLAAAQLASLVSQLIDAPDSPTLHQSLADLAQVKADAVMQALRDHRVGAAPGKQALTSHQSTDATREFRRRITEIAQALREISAGPGEESAIAKKLKSGWQYSRDSLRISMRRHTTKDTVSPDQVVMRARMIEDASQRTPPVQARMQMRVAVTDTGYLSTARLCGRMSALMILLVLGFFLYQRGHHVIGEQASPEVLAFVLTLFSAVQAGRIERSDRSTMRGLLAQRGSWLVLISVLPTVILAIALAFSGTVSWAIGWSAFCLVLQLLIPALMSARLSWDLARGRAADGKTRPSGRVLYSDIPDYTHAEVLHSGWWRNTTADALMVGRQAHAYVIWQHSRPQSLHDLLVASGPGPLAEPEHLDKGAPANVLALQRSGTNRQSVTFAVFRDDPEERWQQLADSVAAPECRSKVELDVGRLAPAEDISAVIGIYLGMERGSWEVIPSHPIRKVLEAASQYHLRILEVQLPVPAPRADYAHLQWARVQIGLRDDHIKVVSEFIDGCIASLTSATSEPSVPGQEAARGERATQPVVGIQTIADGVPRIVNSAAERADPAEVTEPVARDSGRLVLASDLDVLGGKRAVGHAHASGKTWRIAAIVPNWRLGVEYAVLRSMDPKLRLVGLTCAVLYGRAVMLILCHRPEGEENLVEPELTAADGMFTKAKYLNEWQHEAELGTSREWPLLRVHMRTPDRPGATVQTIESLSTALTKMAEGCISDAEGGSVWYARVVVVSGRVAQIQFTVRLNPEPAAAEESLAAWGRAEYSKIERDARDGAVSKPAVTAESTATRVYSPEDTIISVALVKTQSPTSSAHVMSVSSSGPTTTSAMPESPAPTPAAAPSAPAHGSARIRNSAVTLIQRISRRPSSVPLLRVVIAALVLAGALAVSIVVFTTARPPAIWEVIVFDGMTAIGTMLVGVTGLVQILAARKERRNAYAAPSKSPIANSSEAPGDSSPVEEMSQLVTLLEKGVINRQQFDLLSSRLLGEE
jgi:hypothetical protein